MRSMNRLSLLVAVFALCEIGAANASAASFTASVVGTDLERVSNTSQVFSFPNGVIQCSTVAVTGKTTATTATSQHITLNYSGCPAPFGVPAHISPATYLLTAGDTGHSENVHILNSITMTVTAPVFLGGTCHITIPPQKVAHVDYSTSGAHILLDANVTGIDWTGTGGICGTGGSTGTYEGSTTVKAKSGSLAYHH